MSHSKEAPMANPDRPSFFGRDDNPFGTLFREVQKTFEDFSRRTPFARFNSDMLSPKIDVAESKDAIEVTAELPGVDEKDVDVTLTNGMLTVRGEKKTESSVELARYEGSSCNRLAKSTPTFDQRGCMRRSFSSLPRRGSLAPLCIR
jgi:HSP20 family molecular chaperone IbpA